MRQTIGEFLATLRKAKGLTQEDVAFKLSVSNKTLSSWETDRTTPDALTLPAIADLYGVTVDEILRGEKTNKEKDDNANLSEKSKLAIKKKNYGKFSLKHLIFTSFGLLSVILSVLGLTFLVYTSLEVWVGITFSVIGFLGLLTFTILLIFFEKSALLYQGVVDNESTHEEDKSFALVLKRKNSISLLLFSVLFLAFGIVTLVYFLFKGGIYEITLAGVSITINRTLIFIAFIITSLIIGLIYFVAGLCYGNLAVKHFGSEIQKESHKKNAKLAYKTYGIGGGILFVLCIILLILALNPITNYYETSILEESYSKIHTTNFEEFATGLQVFELKEDIVDRDHNILKEKGEYNLSLPDFTTYYEGEVFDLGEGFEGELHLYHDDGFYLGYIDIFYKDYVSGNDYWLASYCPVAIVKNNETIKYLLSFQISKLNEEIEFKAFNLYYENKWSLYNYETKEYGLCGCKTYHFEYFSQQLAGLFSAIAVVVTSTIFLSKKKKQTFTIQ